MKRSSPRRPAAVRDEGLADALVTASFVIAAQLSRIGAEHGLSLTLCRVLGILRDRRPRMSELADYLGLEKQTMSGLIARAEERGLVARAPNPEDRRATDVILTPAGSRLVERMRAEALEALAPLIAPLDPADRRRLQALLQRMLAARDGADGR
jgi:DNA-binding MarR family transcriptional regulator